jgi:hypothetical protein
MNEPNHRYTFEELIEFNNDQLGQLMVAGGTPAIDELIGYEYRGYNIQAATKFLGTRKFKKGFFGNAGEGHAWGYNMPVTQNGKAEPWLAVPNEENPQRYFFFGVLPAGAPGYDKRYAHSLIIDYSLWGDYFFLNPARYTVDYMIYPNPDNRDLMVGKSDFVNGPVRFFLGYFIIERHNKSNYTPPAKLMAKKEKRQASLRAQAFGL